MSVIDRDLGWKKLKAELLRAGEISGKAGVIGPKALAAHMTAEQNDQFAASKRDSKGRFLPGSGAKVAPAAADGEMSNAEVALVNEFGSSDGHVPERSFMRAAFDKNRSKYEAHVEKGTAAVYDGKMTVERMVGLVASEMAADQVALIDEGDGVPPPNAPSTIARKGSSRPLVDSAQMKNAITSAVVHGEKGEG